MRMSGRILLTLGRAPQASRNTSHTASLIFSPTKSKLLTWARLPSTFNFEVLFQVEPIRPADVFRRFINVLLAAVAAFGQAQQHSACGARMQVDAVHLLHTAFARDAAVNGADVLAFDLFEFLG